MIPSFQMIVFTLLLIFLPSASFSQIYKWSNKDGNTSFSDIPPSGIETQNVKVLNDRERSTAPSTSPWKEKREYRDIAVILYMTEWDPSSLRTRAYLKSLGVNLIEYDVKKNKAKNQEKMRKAGGGSGVPVIDVEGIILRGFIPDRIKSAVEKRRNL